MAITNKGQRLSGFKAFSDDQLRVLRYLLEQYLTMSTDATNTVTGKPSQQYICVAMQTAFHNLLIMGTKDPARFCRIINKHNLGCMTKADSYFGNSLINNIFVPNIIEPYFMNSQCKAFSTRLMNLGVPAEERVRVGNVLRRFFVADLVRYLQPGNRSVKEVHRWKDDEYVRTLAFNIHTNAMQKELAELDAVFSSYVGDVVFTADSLGEQSC